MKVCNKSALNILDTISKVCLFSPLTERIALRKLWNKYISKNVIYRELYLDVTTNKLRYDFGSFSKRGCSETK